MNGNDLATLAQNMITYFGGAAGGYLLGAALIVVGILAAFHIISGRAFVHTAALGSLAWFATFAVRTFLAWGA